MLVHFPVMLCFLFTAPK
jgi:methionyl-tRNA synthetase